MAASAAGSASGGAARLELPGQVGHPRRGGAPGQQGRHKAQGQQLSFLHGTPSFYNMVCFLDGFWGKMFRGLKRFLKIFPLAP